MVSFDNIQAIVSDFDGTILRDGMTSPSPYFFELIEKALDRNIAFIAASGRQYANLRHLMEPLSDRIGYICENGCFVVYQQRVVYKSVFPQQLAAQILANIPKEQQRQVLVSGESRGYLLKGNPDFADHMRNVVGNDCEPVNSFQNIQDNIVKIAIRFDSGIPADTTCFFQQKYGSKVNIVDAGNNWLDFNMAGSGKGPALAALADVMNISPDHMIAFGDGENDISMLKAVGMSYAVSSAKPCVKDAAGHVCDSVEEILERILLKR